MGSLQAWACLPALVCQPPHTIFLRALPPTAAELAGWTSCGSVFPFSQSCWGTVFCCLSAFYSRPGPALGLLETWQLLEKREPVNGAYRTVRHLSLPHLSSHTPLALDQQYAGAEQRVCDHLVCLNQILLLNVHRSPYISCAHVMCSQNPFWSSLSSGIISPDPVQSYHWHLMSCPFDTFQRKNIILITFQ